METSPVNKRFSSVDEFPIIVQTRKASVAYHKESESFLRNEGSILWNINVNLDGSRSCLSLVVSLASRRSKYICLSVPDPDPPIIKQKL